MDFHLDSLLNLPNVTVFTSYEKEGFIVLKLEFLNEGIHCPHCPSTRLRMNQTYTDTLPQNRPILVRDLSICGHNIYLQVPRRQFYCLQCKKSPTERLDFLEPRRKYTKRYEEYIYERVKELTVKQVSKNEQLTDEQLEQIFQRMAMLKKKTGELLNA